MTLLPAAPAPGRYLSFDPTAEINGDSVGAVVAGIFVPALGQELLARQGLPATPQPGQWYPMQAWLNLLAEAEDRLGALTLYQTGVLMVDHGVFPTGMPSLLSALQALDGVCRANVRGHDMGHYRVEEAGARRLLMHRRTPHPPEFERGVVTGLARRYKPAEAVRLLVEVHLGAVATAYETTFLITW